MGSAYIISAVRTAGGRRNGRLSGWHPVDLAAEVLDEVVRRAGLDPALVEDVVMGCVNQAAQQSANIARGAVLASGLPQSVPGTTLDRQCGSSQQALHMAAATVISGNMDVVIAAGVESMSRVPMGLPERLGAEAGLGGAMSPRLLARFPDSFSQFVGAEMVASKHGLSRAELDAYALESHLKAAAAANAGAFDAEILPIDFEGPDGTAERHAVDEGIRFNTTLEGLQGLKTLSPDGVLTAGTASQICDGASAVMVVNEAGLRASGVKPLARLHQMTVTAGDPVIMLEEPLFATDRALQRSGLRIEDIDLYEVNEAFASVPLAWLRHTGADPAKLNVNGGAIALGHPLGSSGTKLMTTMIHALAARGGRYGLQTMCEGGGMANVTIVERL